DVLEALDLFPDEVHAGTKAIFFNMGEKESQFAFLVMQQLREKGVSCEMYHEFAKINKQFGYAQKKKIEYAIIIGSKEIEQHYCLVKELATGLQEVVVFERLFEYFTK
ncbi:MAG: His/Gly/Thr/Pro-type tRNA ligase C-terminal domain-containing protein, partial [Ferruginibacter sp.]